MGVVARDDETLDVLFVGTPTATDGVRDRFEAIGPTVTVTTVGSIGGVRTVLAGPGTGIDCVVTTHDPPELDAGTVVRTVRNSAEAVPVLVFAAVDALGGFDDLLATGATQVVPRTDGEGSIANLVNAVTNAVAGHRAQDPRGHWQKVERLHDVATNLKGCREELRAYRQALDAAEEILAFDASAIYVEYDGKLVPTALSRGMLPGAFDVFDLDQGVMGRTYSTGESILIDDVRDDDRPDVTSEEIRSGLSVPIGEVGVFQVISRRTHAFDEADRKLAELLASHIASVVARIRSERAVRTERDRFAALFEHVPDPVVISRREGGAPNVRTVNDAFEETFGYDRETVVGSPIAEYVVSDEGPPAIQLDEYEVGTVVVDEVRRETADGHRDFLFRGFRIEVDDTVEDYAIYTDISEQKAREEALQRQNQRLEEFASIVSHDLRNPLSVLAGAIEGAREDADDEYVEMMETATDRMEQLIDDLLTLARQDDELTTVSPVAVETVARDAWATVDTNGAALDCRAVDGVVVEADRSRFRQCLENLFRNAVEHGSTSPASHAQRDAVEHGSTSPASHAQQDAVEHGSSYDGDGDAGEPSLTVSLETTANGFAVEDDGVGLPADAEDLFELGRSSADGGTGIGLAVVEDVVTAHGWTITATRSDAGGARFEIDVGE